MRYLPREAGIKGLKVLRELLCSWRCRTAGKAARRLGYAREIAALEARHRRLADPWKDHVASTRAALALAAETSRNRAGIALILGGGITDDLPLSALQACFGEIWLLDIAFSPGTWRRAQYSDGRLRCLLADSTGLVADVYGRPSCFEALEISPVLPFPLPARLSFIASVNCLTQLPLLPATWLLRNGADDLAVERWSQRLIAAHLQQMAASGVPACLISEWKDERIDRNGLSSVHADYSPLLQPALTQLGASRYADWTWQVHPVGELPGGESERRWVSAWRW